MPNPADEKPLSRDVPESAKTYRGLPGDVPGIRYPDGPGLVAHEKTSGGPVPPVARFRVLVCFKDGNELAVDVAEIPVLADGIYNDVSGELYVINLTEIQFVRCSPIALVAA